MTKRYHEDELIGPNISHELRTIEIIKTYKTREAAAKAANKPLPADLKGRTLAKPFIIEHTDGRWSAAVYCTPLTQESNDG